MGSLWAIYNGTEATGISRVGIARVRLEINSLILAHQKVFEH